MLRVMLLRGYLCDLYMYLVSQVPQIIPTLIPVITSIYLV